MRARRGGSRPPAIVVMASSAAISMVAICRVHGERISHFWPAHEQPISESSIGRTPSFVPSIQYHAVPQRSVAGSGSGVVVYGAALARARCGVFS